MAKKKGPHYCHCCW